MNKIVEEIANEIQSAAEYDLGDTILCYIDVYADKCSFEEIFEGIRKGVAYVIDGYEKSLLEDEEEEE